MFSALLSGLNSLLYTVLAFLFPLYFTIKALLRQYTVGIIVAPTSFASASFNESEGTMPASASDDSEVPSSFIEAINPSVKAATVTTTTNYISTLSIQSQSPSASPNSSSSWLHYWAILAVIHCFTGIYERILLPFVGNAFVYHCAKYAGIYWLAKDDAKAARALWTAAVAPIAAKYEKEVDRLVQISNQKARILAAKSIASIRKFSIQSRTAASSVKIPLKVE